MRPALKSLETALDCRSPDDIARQRGNQLRSAADRAVERRIGKCLVSVAADCGDRRDAHDEDQGQHDRIFDCGWAVVRTRKPHYCLIASAHHLGAPFWVRLDWLFRLVLELLGGDVMTVCLSASVNPSAAWRPVLAYVAPMPLRHRLAAVLPLSRITRLLRVVSHLGRRLLPHASWNR